jgi:hypothetical protein
MIYNGQLDGSDLRGTRDRRAAYLSGQDDECHADHDHHVELRRPNVGHVVAVADGRECHHHEVGRLEQVEVTVASSLEMLNAADARRTIQRQYRRLFDERLPITW